jgi:hypothetical protein
MSKLLKDDELQTLKVGDNTYELPVLTGALLMDIEREFGGALGDIVKQGQVTVMYKLLWIILKSKYTDLKFEDITSQKVTVSSLKEISKKVSEVLAVLTEE